MTELILLDIEGAVLPIRFVTDVLFPFARVRIAAWVHSQWNELDHELGQLFAEHRQDSTARLSPPGLQNNAASVSRYLLWLMERERKSTPLKTIQGLIWQEGFTRGELQSAFFPDVPAALRRWQAAGIPAAIFSSGSVLAQKLLFTHSESGDLTPFITAWFDTNIGSKKDTESYGRIAGALNVPASATLFVSDSLSELNAAREAGMQTALADRPGNPPIQEAHEHAVIPDFNAIGTTAFRSLN